MTVMILLAVCALLFGAVGVLLPRFYVWVYCSTLKELEKKRARGTK